MDDYQRLLADLAAEHADLDAVVTGLDDYGFATPTPAEGWTVGDQLSHLAFFDEAAHRAATDAEGFVADLARALEDVDAYMAAPIERGRSLAAEERLRWWRGARTAVLSAFASLDPSQRLPWYGPPMSAMSFATARLMETWAHGQDVVDALAVDRAATDRLRHIAHLGVRTRGFSYAVRGREAPPDPVRVVLTSPSGEEWTWGPDDAVDEVHGSALDFCLVVTQRRHLDDTAMVVTGAASREWMGLAQAFAGGPGPGRPPSTG
ncbi:TIGR03084 family metal-binding protein [soil metagenome]